LPDTLPVKIVMEQVNAPSNAKALDAREKLGSRQELAVYGEIELQCQR
jgi:hypothetical protein